MIQADRSMCEESRVVLRSPENTARVILAKTDTYPQKKNYTMLLMLTNKY